MKKLILACFATAMVAPAVQAAVISIGDPLSGLDADETLTVLINEPTTVTAPPNPAPGTGTVITQANAGSLNFGSFGGSGFTGFGSSCGPGPETPQCNFQFLDQVPWGSNVFFYRYFTEPGSTAFSDLFVIQGLGGTNPDYVSFISSDSLTGNILTDFTGPVISTAARTALPTLQEGPDWLLAMDTGVDQYYIKSVPEPATLTLLGLGLAGLGFSRRRN